MIALAIAPSFIRSEDFDLMASRIQMEDIGMDYYVRSIDLTEAVRLLRSKVRSVIRAREKLAHGYVRTNTRRKKEKLETSKSIRTED